jgi:hypothetical protein
MVYANLSVEMEGLSSEQILLCESKEVGKNQMQKFKEMCHTHWCCLFFWDFFPLLGQVGSPCLHFARLRYVCCERHIGRDVSTHQIESSED